MDCFNIKINWYKIYVKYDRGKLLLSCLHGHHLLNSYFIQWREDGVYGIVILTSYKFHFIRVHDNHV